MKCPVFPYSTGSIAFSRFSACGGRRRCSSGPLCHPVRHFSWHYTYLRFSLNHPTNTLLPSLVFLMKERDRDDETSDTDEPSSPIVFTKRIDTSESILKLVILVLISVLSFRYGSSVSIVIGLFLYT
jgi:hypothetical protein